MQHLPKPATIRGQFWSGDGEFDETTVTVSATPRETADRPEDWLAGQKLEHIRHLSPVLRFRHVAD
jgi:hypothetical protein